jgi:hypothetical protein
MTAPASSRHGLGLRVGSYLNNCICAEGGKSPPHYAQDVAWLVGLGFVRPALDRRELLAQAASRVCAV